MVEHQKSDGNETDWQNMLTDDGVFAVDSHQRIAYWSEGAQRILGHAPEDVVGAQCFAVVGGRDSRNHSFCRRGCPVMENARRGRSTPNYDVMCVSQAGEPKWINVTIAVPKGQRRGASILHVFRDVSDRRRTEEFALRASKALRELLSEDGPDTSEAADPRLPLPRLSRRELEVLRLLAVGMKTREIAKALGVQPVTARNHITRLLTKLGVENRLQAVIYASDRKII